MCFILPAALITLAFAWAYVRYGSLPQTAAFLYGVKPVIIAVIVQAIWLLGRSAVKTRLLAGIGALSVAASLAGFNVLLVLAGAGVLTALITVPARSRGEGLRAGALLAAPGAAAGTGASVLAAGVAAPASLAGLFLVFLKVGALLFGSGYVLLAFLRADLVAGGHWLTESQLLDAVAVGQLTPGPVFTTATFIGYVLRGGWGALVATVGIFLPGFVFVAISGPLVPRLRRSPAAAAFLDGVTVASLALMVAVTWYLGRSALVDPLTILLAILGALLLLRYRVNSAWLVFGGAAAGIAASALR